MLIPRTGKRKGVVRYHEVILEAPLIFLLLGKPVPYNLGLLVLYVIPLPEIGAGVLEENVGRASTKPMLVDLIIKEHHFLVGTLQIKQTKQNASSLSCQPKKRR